METINTLLEAINRILFGILGVVFAITLTIVLLYAAYLTVFKML